MYTKQLWRIFTLSLPMAVLILANSGFEPAAAAGPWFVTPGGDDSNDCLTPGTACQTINGAIGKASSGDVINVAEGTYTDSTTVVVIIDKDLTFYGGWDLTFSSQTGFSIVDGERARKGVYTWNGTTSTMDRFSVIRGRISGVENVGTLTLDNCDVSGTDNAGITNLKTLTLNYCTIHHNSGGEGGGIYNVFGTLTINNSSISNNESRNRGGGIRNDAILNINNSTISRNTAGNRGGGISSYSGTLSINSSTIAANYAADGGGIYQEGGTITMQNTIMATNTANSGPNCIGTIGSAGYNLIGDMTTCGFSTSSGDLTDENPDLGSLIGPTDAPFYLPLLTSSPAINAGNPAGCLDHSGTLLTTDQRDLARVGTCDIGAYEYATPGSASQISAVGGTPQRTIPSSEFEQPLQAAVMDGNGSPVQSVNVDFNAPVSGPSGNFTDSGNESTSAITNESGVATTSSFTANGIIGSYEVTANTSGILTSAEFQLTNIFWYVTTSGDNANICQAVGTPCASINGVLEKSDFHPGDTILVASGTYTSSRTEVVNIDITCAVLGGWDDTFSTQEGRSILDGENSRKGLTVLFPAEVRLDTFTIQNGSASSNAGVSNSGVLWLINSIVRNNIADHSTGGIKNSGTLYLVNSTVYDNEALYYSGGGLSNGGSAYIINSTISNNFAKERGGGIYTSSGAIEIFSSTITRNWTDYSGGGGINRYSNGSITMQNTILAGNIGGTYPDCLGPITSGGNNLIGDTTGCTFTSTPSDLIGLDPDLGPLIGSPGYHPLILGSPAINGGNVSGCLDQKGNPLLVDQRGASRVGVCDIGAYEFTTPGSPFLISMYQGSPQSSPPNIQYWQPLEALVLDDIGTPVGGVTVSFTAPSSGPSGTFEDTVSTNTTAITNDFGVATASPIYANGLEGAFSVEATVGGVSEPASFALLNGGWYISTTGDGLNDCRTPSTPCPWINSVLYIPAFEPGDTILVAGGTYYSTSPPGIGNEVVHLTKDVRIIGGWNETFDSQDATTVYDGENLRRGITIDDGINVFIDNVIIQNGFRELANGGGIQNYGNLHLRNCSILNSTGVSGGGISSGFGSIASIIIENCTLSGNSGGGAGGIQASGSVAIINSVISGNTTGGVSGSGITIHSSTIANNNGAGISSSSIVYLENSIVTGNSGNSNFDCLGDITSLGYNIIGDTTGCSFASATGDILDVDPKIGPLTGSPGHHPLLSESPAVNAGNPAGCSDHLGNTIDYDIRGAMRMGRCDIGAYEAQSYKDVSDYKAMPGDTLIYTIGFLNWLDTPQPYTVRDTLPNELTYIEGTLSATSGTPSHSSGVISWSDTVDPGQEVSITFDAEVGSILGPLVNSAVINDGSTDITRSATTMIDPPICSLTKQPGNPVFNVGSPDSWDDNSVWSPTVILDGSTYRMWYSGDDGSGIFQIGLATSPDGITWSRSGSNPVLSPSQSWEISRVSSPSVILDGTTYKMWYTGVDGAGVAHIGYATSSDGIVWTKHAGNPVLDVGAGGTWESEDVSSPTVVKIDSTYHLWYTGTDGSTSRVGHATSTNGITWVKDSANPVLDVGDVGEWDWLNVYSPDVVKVGDAFRMWYSGGTLPVAWQTGYAESSDGSAWIRKRMLIPEGPPGSFDAFSADHASVLVEGSAYRIWYGGIDSSDIYTIGLATANTCSGAAYNLFLPMVINLYPPVQTCPPDYADDFSDPSSGWFIYEDSSVNYGYVGGEYQIWVKNPDDGRWVTPGAKASDFTVAVSARRTSGNDGPYGILFGISQDWNELYEVSINEDYYAIWKYDSGWSLLTWSPSPAIQTGTAWNRVKVTREGTAISLYINDQFQTTVNDGSFTGFRRIGLSAYSPTGSGLDVRFDDFALYPASCGPMAAFASGIEWGEAEAHQEITPHPPYEIE